MKMMVRRVIKKTVFAVFISPPEPSPPSPLPFWERGRGEGIIK
jgi:hypothetical protein